eukprot:1104489-Pyramimonas_sp.AAC.1
MWPPPPIRRTRPGGRAAATSWGGAGTPRARFGARARWRSGGSELRGGRGPRHRSDVSILSRRGPPRRILDRRATKKHLARNCKNARPCDGRGRAGPGQG